jgi:hypothetical protein
MTFRRAARSFAQNAALFMALSAFTAVLLDASPSIVLEENETECEIEVEDIALTELGTTVSPILLRAQHAERESVHTVRETEVLRTRNVTFRIDRPPPV